MTDADRKPAEMAQAIKTAEAELRTPLARDRQRLFALDAKFRYDSFRAAGFDRYEALALTIGRPA